MLSAILPPTMEGAIEPADVSEAEQIIKRQYLCYQPQIRPPVPRVALYYGFVGREITSSALAHRAQADTPCARPGQQRAVAWSVDVDDAIV
jgi:hypothetical protein